MNKNIFLIFVIISCVSMIILSHARGDISTKESLLEQFKSALRENNQEQIERLFIWEGVPEDLKSSTLGRMKQLLTEEIISIHLKPLPNDFKSEHVVKGTRYRPNLPILGFIEVKHIPRNGSDGTSMPYGSDGNNYYFTSTIQEKVADSSVNSVSLNVAVFGNASYPNDDGFSGYCIYLEGDQEVKKEFEGNGNKSYAFWGNKFKYCEVFKASGDSPIGLSVSEDGKEVFRSEVQPAFEPIVYSAN